MEQGLFQNYASEVVNRQNEEQLQIRQPKIKFEPKTVKKKKEKCYTCHPKTYVKKHKFYEENNFSFHFDLTKRPIIIVTPNKHVETTHELTKDELFDMFEVIKNFCINRNIVDYQLMTNMGEWKTHSHLHWKIKIDEDTCYRMRSDHFKLKKLEQNFN